MRTLPVRQLIAVAAALLAACGSAEIEVVDESVVLGSAAYYDEVLPPGIPEDHATDDFLIDPEDVPKQGWGNNIQFPQRAQTVYLNFEGATLQYAAPNNAAENRTSLLYRLVDPDSGKAWEELRRNGYSMDVFATIPRFEHSSFGNDRQRVIDDVAAKVRADLANFNLTVTTTRPRSGSYAMAVIGGTSALIGAPSNYIGLAPLDLGNKNLNDIALIFPRAWSDTFALSKTISHELAHTFGLYHTEVSNGIMSPSLLRPYENQKFNEGKVIKDGLEHLAPPDWQRDLAEMLRVLGPSQSCYSRFPDVSASHPENRTIGTLACAGVLAGYPDGLFHAEESATRAQLATVAVRTMEFLVVRPARATYPDVATSHWAFANVETATAQSVFSGFPDGTFHPEDLITRSQLAAVAVRMAGWTAPSGSCGRRASDVPGTYWACSVVETALANDAMALDSNGRFNPEQPANRAEVAHAFERIWMR